MDIATLGLEVKPIGLRESTHGLKGVAEQASRTETATERMNRQVERSQRHMQTLARAAGALAAALGVNALVRYADAWSDMQSRVGAAVKSMEAAPALMKRMVDLANASYSPLEQTVEVYTRNVGVLRDLGYAADGAADFTEALNHALVITATRGERASAVQNALSKAMAVGKLQADALETVLANGGRVAEALAEQLGTTVSGLRAMASEGKITGDVIASALTGSLERLREEAAEMPATIGDAFTRIQNNFTALVGILDQAWGVSGAVAEQMLSLADGILAAADVLLRLGNVAGMVVGPAFDALASNIELVGQVGTVAGAALLGFFAGPMLITGIGAATTALVTGLIPALGAVATAIKGITLAMLANPLGLLIGGLAAAVTAAFMFRDEIKQAIGVDVVEVFRNGANWIIAAMVGAVNAVMAAWGVLPAFMETLGKQAWNAFLSGFEGSAVTWTNPFTGEVFDLIKLDLTDFKYKIEGEAADIAGAVSNAFKDAQSVDYIGELEKGLGALWQSAEAGSGAVSDLASSIGGGGGGAGGGLTGAAGKANEALNKLIATADQLAEKMFPGEYARREAEALAAALDQYGSALDEFQRRAVETEIADLFKASALGLRNLKGEAKSAANEVSKTLGSALQSLVDGPILNFEDAMHRVLGSLASLGNQNFSKITDGILGGFAANDNGSWVSPNGYAKLLGEAVQAGAESGSSTGIFGGLGQLLGGKGGGMISAGLGGLGLGYQTQNPLVGGLGGALQGFAAMGGNPLGAVIGGIGGRVGGKVWIKPAANQNNAVSDKRNA